MKRLFTLLVFITIAIPASAQINTAESSVQIIGFWDKNEKHTYEFINESASVKGTDTTVTETIKYKVDIAVVDSTATSYTVEWKYRDFTVNSNPLGTKLAKMNEGLVLRIKTDEIGIFRELLNWEEVKKFNDNALKLVEKEKDATVAQNFIIALKQKNSSKEAIETHSLKDVQQFYDFFGIAIKMDEPITEKVTELNAMTQKPVNSQITLELVEIDLDNNAYLVAYDQIFDQQTAMTMVKSLVGDLVPAHILDEMKSISIEDARAASMHESGWPLSMYYERVINLEGRIKIESRQINFLE